MEQEKETFKAFVQSCLDFVVNNKKEVKNEDVDKRKLIDEVGGILKGKVDDEIIRTIIGKLEKVAYDKSEDKTADNEDDEEKAENKKACNEEEEDDKAENKKACNEDEEEKKADNSVDYMEKVAKVSKEIKNENENQVDYVSRADKLQAAIDYFKV